MGTIDLDLEFSRLDTSDLKRLEEAVIKARDILLKREGAGSEFTGWMDWPDRLSAEDILKIQECAKKIISESEVLLVIGIGGSYLGAEAGYRFLSGTSSKGVDLIFAGNTLSGDYLDEILKSLKGKDWSINVISKSGTTLEPSVSFRIFKKALYDRYGEAAKERIYATTDASCGALKREAELAGYSTFVIPDDIGGRFSVLTPVGLLPLAAAGFDIKSIVEGAACQRKECLEKEFLENPALKYAAIRNIELKAGKEIELLCVYDPAIKSIGDWWAQLFGESEGKDGKGLFPARACYTTDLHSLGQYVQEGRRILFETVIYPKESLSNITLPVCDDDEDGLAYIEGKSLGYINKCAMRGTAKAHMDGGVPGFLISFKRRDEFNLGALFYFFEFACGVSAYMLGVNPFNQPGVEAYKKEVKDRLKKD